MFSGTLSPSRPDPCLVFIVCVLLLLFVWFVHRRRVFSSSLSLRRRGNPNPPKAVWCSPCVSSSCTRTPPSTRTSLSTPTPRPSTALAFVFLFVFFFCSSSFSGSGVFCFFFFGFVLVVLGFLVVSLVLVLVVLAC